MSRILDPRFYLKALVGLSALALVVLPLGADAVNAALKSARGPTGDCRVLSVIDGDTLSLWCADRGPERARLTGFDAPELFSPGCAAEYLAAQKATWALRQMIFDADAIDFQFSGQDRYDRTLVAMRLDGTSVARRMIAAGLARTYDGGARGGWCAG